MAELAPIHQRFVRRLDILEDIFTNWAVHAARRPSHEEVMFLEGLLSNLWQHWALFCRRIVVASALGCTTRSGRTHPSCVLPRTWERISYIAWRVNSGGKVKPLLTNADLKREPTWGDVRKVQDVIAELSLGNGSQLISCLGSVSRGPIDAQRVRNAAAHRNKQSFADVKSLSLYYNANKICHPVEALLWVEPVSKDYAFVAWVDEMRLLADMMTS